MGGPRGESRGGACCSLRQPRVQVGFQGAGGQGPAGVKDPSNPTDASGSIPGDPLCPYGRRSRLLSSRKACFCLWGLWFQYSVFKAKGPRTGIRSGSLSPLSAAPRVQPSAPTTPPCRNRDPSLGEDQQEGARGQVGSAPGGAGFTQGRGQGQGQMSFCKVLSRGREPGVSLFWPILFANGPSGAPLEGGHHARPPAAPGNSPLPGSRWVGETLAAATQLGCPSVGSCSEGDVTGWGAPVGMAVQVVLCDQT